MIEPRCLISWLHSRGSFQAHFVASGKWFRRNLISLLLRPAGHRPRVLRCIQSGVAGDQRQLTSARCEFGLKGSCLPMRTLMFASHARRLAITGAGPKAHAPIRPGNYCGTPSTTKVRHFATFAHRQEILERR
jgi:hypothetical protein